LSCLYSLRRYTSPWRRSREAEALRVAPADLVLQVARRGVVTAKPHVEEWWRETARPVMIRGGRGFVSGVALARLTRRTPPPPEPLSARRGSLLGHRGASEAHSVAPGRILRCRGCPAWTSRPSRVDGLTRCEPAPKRAQRTQRSAVAPLRKTLVRPTPCPCGGGPRSPSSTASDCGPR